MSLNGLIKDTDDMFRIRVHGHYAQEIDHKIVIARSNHWIKNWDNVYPRTNEM